MERIWRGCRLHIRVENEGVEHGVKALYVDGEKAEGNLILPELLKGKREAEVLVRMG